MKKLCKGCGDDKDLDEFHKKKSGKFGVAFFCKICTVAKRAEYRKTNPKDVAVSKKKWAQKNPDKNRAGTVRWRKRNPEKATLMDKIYAARYMSKHPVRIKEARRVRYQSNAEFFRLKRRVYAKNNPHMEAANDALRRARKMNATPPWCEKDEIKALYKSAADLREMGIDTHVDHILPLAGKLVCGLHCFDNLQLLSPWENLSKGNRYG